jgi:predicted regulator of Ras-like GTPase activity (Roadblock/LC7/MglB family)
MTAGVLFGTRNPVDSSRSALINLMRNLTINDDIKGAALVSKEGTILACDVPDNTVFTTNIPRIMDIMNLCEGSFGAESSNIMFNQTIFNYNESKVIAKKLRTGIALLVLMDRTGYVSLVMLEIENSTRMINQVFHEDIHDDIRPGENQEVG